MVEVWKLLEEIGRHADNFTQLIRKLYLDATEEIPLPLGFLFVMLVFMLYGGEKESSQNRKKPNR